MYQRLKHKKIIRMGKLGVKQKLCLSGYNTLETTQVSIKVKQINTYGTFLHENNIQQ